MVSFIVHLQGKSGGFMKKIMMTILITLFSFGIIFTQQKQAIEQFKKDSATLPDSSISL